MDQVSYLHCARDEGNDLQKRIGLSIHPDGIEEKEFPQGGFA
jgi:hypothetical protein